MTLRQPDPAPGAEPERGFVVAVLAQGADSARELDELRELARTAGVEPVGELVQHRARPDRRTYVGKGKLVELKEAFGRSQAESLLVDDELSPVQQRELENALQARVVGSRVSKSRSRTETSAPVRVFRRVDLPAFV